MGTDALGRPLILILWLTGLPSCWILGLQGRVIVLCEGVAFGELEFALGCSEGLWELGRLIDVGARQNRSIGIEIGGIVRRPF